MSKVTEKAVDWMLDLARDDSHGYDQDDRWGEHGDYDCSSAVITAYQKAGVPVKTKGATYTGNMKKVFLACGFKDVTFKVDLRTGKGLQAGDVLLNEVHHTAMYVGDGLEAEASINEFGGAHGGRPGDQTGREILVRAYRNYPWDCVLRYESGEPSTEGQEPVKPTEEKKEAFSFTVREICIGDKSADVKLLQTLLSGVGFLGKDGKALELDGDFGRNTEYAVRGYQCTHGLDIDGIVGKKTWRSILGL